MKRAFWFRVESRGLLAMSRGMKPHDVGIYMILSSLMHDRQEPLAYEPAWLARYCNTSKSAFEKAVDLLVCDGLFWLENGRLGSEHIQNELARCDEITEKARSSANARHRKNKENQSTGDADAMRNKRKTSDTDTEGKTPKGSSPSTTQSTSSSTQPDHKQDTRPAAPDSASAASSDNRASDGDVYYCLAILQERGVKEAELGKIWKVHTTRGLDMTMLATILRMASEGRLTATDVERVAGGPNA